VKNIEEIGAERFVPRGRQFLISGMDRSLIVYDFDASPVAFKGKNFDKKWWAGSSVVYDSEMDVG